MIEKEESLQELDVNREDEQTDIMNSESRASQLGHNTLSFQPVQSTDGNIRH